MQARHRTKRFRLRAVFWYVECLPRSRKRVYIPTNVATKGSLPKSHGDPPRHSGYALSKAIRTNSGEILKVDTGSLYPALHRLERKGWIAAEWKASELGPRLRVYHLTKAGKRQLMSERSRWRRLTAAIAGILDPAQKENAP